MKYLFLLLFLFIFNCASINSFSINEEVYLDSYNAWVKNTSDIKSIHMRVINKRYRDVNIEVSCYFCDNTLFGKKTVFVKMREDAEVTIIGFSKAGREKITCGITKIK